MILGAEIGLLIMGIYAVVTGKMTLSKTRVIRGTPARALGVVAILPLPLSFAIGLIVGVMMVAQGQSVNTGSNRWVFAGIEATIVVVCVIAIYAIGGRYAGPPDA